MDNDRYEFARKHGLKEQKVIDASSGISPFGPSKRVRAALRKSLKKIAAYPDGSSALLRRFFRSRFAVPEDCIFFSERLQRLLCLLTEVLRPNKVVAVGPAPRLYTDVAAAHGVPLVCVRGDEAEGFIPDVARIAECAESGDLLIIANPNRITGKKSTAGEIEAIQKTAADGVTVVIDESLMEFTGEKGLFAEAAARNGVIAVTTTANFFGLPGLELACAVSSKSVIDRLASKGCCGVNVLAADAARTALKDKTYQKVTRQQIADERRLFASALNSIEGVSSYPSDSNMILVRLERRHVWILESLARSGFMVERADDLCDDASTYVSLSVMKHEHNLKFLRHLKRLKDAGRE